MFKSHKIFRNIVKNNSWLQKMSSESEWIGVPVSHIQGSHSPWSTPEFPLVRPSYNHSVLYHISGNGELLDRPPKPQIGKDMWDHDHVRLPCSSQSLYPIEDKGGQKNLKRRWDIIQNALSKPIKNSHQLEEAILSYNTQFKNRWKFPSLHKLFNDYLEEEESTYFFDVTLPEIAKLALALPKLIQCPIPLLKQNRNKSLSLSQQQVACLLANAFFCTFPRRNTMKKQSEYATYPHINFNVLYNCSPADNILEKLKCICHYFRRVCTKVPVGVVTLRRRSARATPSWAASRRPLAALPLHVASRGTIEDAQGLLQVDFANKYLGGGVLTHGCVQEEIRFMICPELLVSLLVTEVLKPNEALIMIGCERYSDYSGYASSFQWSGAHADACPHDSSGRRRCAVLAIDATPYATRRHEYAREAITRELNKAWVGFSSFTGEDGAEDLSEEAAEVTLQFPGVATGNWGCGAFGGSAELKSLIQIMAAVRAGRPLAYYTFGDVQLRDNVMRVYSELAARNATVGQLYEYMLRYCKTDVKNTSLNKFLERVLNDPKPTPPPPPPPPHPPATAPVTNAATVNYTAEKEKEDLSIFLQHISESPDMFTQEDAESSATSKIDESNLNENYVVGVSTKSSQNVAIVNDASINIMEISDENVEATNMVSHNDTSYTSRLFDEMGKLDEQSGKLNLNSPQQTFFADLRSDAAEDKIHFEVTSEVKKKITKKITDYFSKKPV